MSTIKKQYQSIIEFLENNSSKKVSTILDELKAMCTSKTQSQTSIKVNGEVVAIFCYYHKQWEDPKVVPYGQKASNKSTGLNTMCKVGVSEWTKQQNRLKQVNSEVLDLVTKGEISVTQVEEKKLELEMIAKQPDSKVDVPVCLTQEEVDSYLENQDQVAEEEK